MTGYVAALRKAIAQHKLELSNMEAALANHLATEADIEIIKQQERAAERRSGSEGAKRP